MGQTNTTGMEEAGKLHLDPGWGAGSGEEGVRVRGASYPALDKMPTLGHKVVVGTPGRL